MKKQVVILGAGVGGLSAGWMLSRTGLFDVTVIEKAPVIGGMCGTFQHEDMLLDYGPHKCYSTMPDILEELKTLMGNELITHKKQNSIYLFGRYLNYPIQFSELISGMGVKNLVRCAGSLIPVLLRSFQKKEPRSYEEYVCRRFGKTLYQLVFEPLAQKTWGSPATLSADIARTRIPSQSLFDLAARVLGIKKETSQTDAAYFYYPKKGFGRIPARMAEEIKKNGGTILTSASPTKICLKKNRVESVEISHEGVSKKFPVDYLISTLPFDVVLNLMDLPVLEMSNRLEYRGVFLVYLMCNREKITKDHWLFFPEKEVLFGRIFEQKNLSPSMIPPNKTVLCCDFTVGPKDPLWQMSEEVLARRCAKDLQHVGIINENDINQFLVKRFPKFYPRYDLNYKETTEALYSSLKKYDNFLSTGRIGFYNYNNSDHCVDMGKYIATSLAQNAKTQEIWEGLEKRVTEYRIVD